MAIVWLMMVNIVSGWWLSPTPLKNMSLSVGMMKFPIDGKKCSKPPSRYGSFT